MSYYIYLRQYEETLDPVVTMLYDAGWPDGAQFLPEASLTKELDQPGKLTFSMTPDHPLYGDIRLMLDTIDVFEDRTLIFRGRAVRIKTTRDRKRTVTCEECLHWLADVPDRFSYESGEAYKLGTTDKAKELIFSGTKEDFRHEWAGGDGFEDITVLEYDSVFDVELDGKTYHVPMEELYEYPDGAAVRCGYLGAASIYNSDYKNEDGSAGSSAPFYISNTGIWIKPKEDETADEGSGSDGDTSVPDETHTVKIVRRDSLPVAWMFRNMIRWENSGTGGYNTQCSVHRRMKSDLCNVEGSMVYSPSQGDTCLDTLRAWQKKFGGYLSIRYVPERVSVGGTEEINWVPHVCYRSEAGDERDDVPVSYGVNLTDISIEENGDGVATAIRGTAEQNDRTYTLADALCPVIPDPGYDLLLGNGYLRKDATRLKYGAVLRDKRYTLPDDEFEPVEDGYADGKNPLQIEWYQEYAYEDGTANYRRSEHTAAQDGTKYYTKPKYDVVPESSASGKNPKELGWYERKGPEKNGDRYRYVLTEDETAQQKTYYEDATWRRLYALVKADLDTADSEASAASVTALDPRLLGIDSGRPEVGCSYPVYSAAHGLNGQKYILTKNDINLAEPGRGKLTLGRETDLLTRQVAIIRQGGR